MPGMSLFLHQLVLTITRSPGPADKLMEENMSKNLIDQDEYPMTRESTHEFGAACATTDCGH